MRIVLPHPGPTYGDNLVIKVERGEQTDEAELEALAAEIRRTIREQLVFTPVIQWVDPNTFERSQYKVTYFEKAWEA